MHAHAKFCKSSEKSHLLGGNLAGGKKSHAVLTMFFLNRLKAVAEGVGGGLPVGGLAV